ncbi:unnamed protein product, partial [Effrenium voratum]
RRQKPRGGQALRLGAGQALRGLRVRAERLQRVQARHGEVLRGQSDWESALLHRGVPLHTRPPQRLAVSALEVADDGRCVPRGAAGSRGAVCFQAPAAGAAGCAP